MKRVLKEFWRNLMWPHSSKAIQFLETPNLLEVKRSCEKVAERRIFCFWMGGELTLNRRDCLSALDAVCGVPIILVTKDNLNDWVVQADPLPDEFNYLSAVHKADFLRVYFMYHHGGGYCDVKRPERSWKRAFEVLNHSNDKFGLGYSEIGPKGVANIKPRGDYRKRDVYHFNNKMKNEYSTLIGNGAYIFKPKNPLMRIVLYEQKRRLKAFGRQLQMYPGNAYGDNEGYPLDWSYVLGEIFHPAQMAFRDYLLHLDDVRPSFLSYR